MKAKAGLFFYSRNIAYLAVLLALVIVLQIWGSGIRIGTVGFSFVLVPIVLGGIMIGPLAGGFLGLAFGIIVLVNGAIGNEPLTFYLFSQNPVFTSVLCLVKGTAAGFVSGILFRVLRRKNQYVAVFAASAAAPFVNTTLFILGGLMMSGTLSGFLSSNGMDSSVIYFLVIGCAGVNFLVEFAINLVAAPALYRVSRIFMKSDITETEETAAQENERTEPTESVSDGQ